MTPILSGSESKWPNTHSYHGIPKQGRHQNGCTTPCYDGPPQWGGIKMAPQPMPTWRRPNGETSKRLHTSVISKKADRKRLPDACRLRVSGKTSKWLYNPHVPRTGSKKAATTNILQQNMGFPSENALKLPSQYFWEKGREVCEPRHGINFLNNPPIPPGRRDGIGCITPAVSGLAKCGEDSHGHITTAVLGYPRQGSLGYHLGSQWSGVYRNKKMPGVQTLPL